MEREFLEMNIVSLRDDQSEKEMQKRKRNNRYMKMMKR